MNVKLSEADKLELHLRTLEFKIQRIQLNTNETIIVQTQNGKIKGAKRCGIYDDTYYSFEHIPFAQPPMGELRFRSPKPVTSWKNIRDCTQYGKKPIQKYLLLKDIEGSEDCLYLNVYTKNVSPTSKRPVMVWIYGGGFTFGEATPEWYGPDYFMKKDVVLVTVQYRLGVLGFLSLEGRELHVPGNAGIKDQIMALKWIKRNCASFGGNPDCITVFGESAGGISVNLLMQSDDAKGLFHRAILQSAALPPGWIDKHSSEPPFTLAQSLGYTGKKINADILKFLMDCTAEDIVRAETECTNNNQFKPFKPCIEPYLTAHTLLKKPYEEVLEHSWGNSIPIMIGATSKEGLIFLPLVKSNPQIVEQNMETCEMFVPKASIAQPDSIEVKKKGLILRNLYVKDDKPTEDSYYNITTDAYYWHPIHYFINERHKYAKKVSNYLYRFDFDSGKLIYPFRLVRGGRGGDCVKGVAHTDELGYLFSSTFADRMEQNSREYRTIECMISLWTAFAETGNPNTAKIHGMKGVKWNPLRREESQLKCLNISDELKFIDLPEMGNLNIWQELYNDHSQLPKSTNELFSEDVYVKSTL